MYVILITCAFVSTSPTFHADIINECLQAGIHVFTELNLIPDRYDENIRIANDRNLTLFLSSTFLYREEVKYIMQQTSRISSKLNYNYHIGQYLPDWHPWETYHDFFVADKRTNGCREIFAIELPWLIKTFGKILSFQVLKSKNTSLDINYMDNYLLLFEHERNNKGMIAVDVMSRKAVRNLEIYNEKIHVFWDGTPHGLRKYDIDNKIDLQINLYKQIDKETQYSDLIIENAYKNELCHFFDVISGQSSLLYTFEQDREILNLISKIESE